MNDDWRIQVDFLEEGFADALHDQLDAEELKHDLSGAFHDRVVATRDGTTVFLYAGDRDQAERAKTLVEELTQKAEEEVRIAFTRWHPEAEEWRPADEALPADGEAKATEHAARVAHERQETEENGSPEYEVRIDLPSHGEAKDLVERLDAEGLRSVHRWRYVLLGAADEDSANELAERVRSEVPPGSKVVVEGTWREAYAERPHSPFTFLGGLAE
jgi:hypothetical protein